MNPINNGTNELEREREDWYRLAAEGLARAYSDNEPEYTLADIKPKENLTPKNSTEAT